MPARQTAAVIPISRVEAALWDHPTRLRLAQVACVLVGVALTMHATFRGQYADLDAFAYVDWYQAMRGIEWADFVRGATAGIYFQGDAPYRFEVGFAALAFACAAFGLGTQGFFFVCAVLSIWPKIFTLLRYSHAPLAAFAWYASWQYILLEMNAIRAGIAAAILMMGLRHVLDGKLLRFLPYVAVGCLFHLSAISGLLVFAARFGRPDWRLLAGVVVASIVLSFVPLLPVLSPLAVFSSKIQEYLTLLTQGDAYTSINVFNALSLARLLLFGGLVFALTRTSWSKLEVFGLWCMAITLSLYFALASFPVMAGRLSEFVSVFQILCVSALLRAFTPTFLPRLFLLLLLLVQFWAVTYHSGLADFFYFLDMPWLRVRLYVAP